MASWPTRRALTSEVLEYIEGFYNLLRRHSTLGILSPAELEQQRAALPRTRAREIPAPAGTPASERPVHASWLNQIDLYFSILQRTAPTPNDLVTLDQLAERLLAFGQHYRQIARPFANGPSPAETSTSS